MNHGGTQQQRSPGFNGGCLHNMSVPPRTQVLLEVRPVFGAVLVSLSHCLRLKGVIDPGLKHEFSDCLDVAEAALRWAGRWTLESFWRKVGPLGCNPGAVGAAATGFGGARIGWAIEICPPIPNTLLDVPAYNRICTDLSLTVAILSRRAGNLFLSYREPEYSPEQLFRWAFVADDPSLTARSISWNEWPQKDNQKSLPKECPLLFREQIDQPNRRTLNL